MTTMQICAVPGCDNRAVYTTLSLCPLHRGRWHTRGRPTDYQSLVQGRSITSAEERFWKKVDRSGGADACWPWRGGYASNGYGSFTPVKGLPPVRTHRFAYEMAKGPIPAGLVIDHLCRNKACVNPEHLEAVPQGENIRRGSGPRITRARHATKTHCIRGHAFTPDNTYIKPNGSRACKACKAASSRRRAATPEGRARNAAATARYRARRHAPMG